MNKRVPVAGLRRDTHTFDKGRTIQGDFSAGRGASWTIERAHPEILAVNVFAGFAFANTPCAGVSFTAVATGDLAQAQADLAGLCELTWTWREQGDPPHSSGYRHATDCRTPDRPDEDRRTDH